VELIGSSDHLAHELPILIEMARRSTLDLSGVISETVPLDAAAINEAMDRLESYGSDMRIVITP
jgi:propanol-preferring alcohol dehydrogenase